MFFSGIFYSYVKDYLQVSAIISKGGRKSAFLSLSVQEGGADALGSRGFCADQAVQTRDDCVGWYYLCFDCKV